MKTPWKVLLGLLGVAALVTVITVPLVLLNKGLKENPNMRRKEPPGREKITSIKFPERIQDPFPVEITEMSLKGSFVHVRGQSLHALLYKSSVDRCQHF